MWTSKETGDYTVWYSTYHGSYHPVAKATIKSNKFKSYFSQKGQQPLTQDVITKPQPFLALTNIVDKKYFIVSSGNLQGSVNRKKSEEKTFKKNVKQQN